MRNDHVHGGLAARAWWCDAAFASGEASIGQWPMAQASANPSSYNIEERRGRAAMSCPSHGGPELGGALMDMVMMAMALA